MQPKSSKTVAFIHGLFMNPKNWQPWINYFEAYKDTGSKKDFKQFPGRRHYICGQAGGEEVAGYVAEWVAGVK